MKQFIMRLQSMHETLFVFIIITFIDFSSVSIVTFGRFGAFCLQGKVVCSVYLCNIQTTSDSLLDGHLLLGT